MPEDNLQKLGEAEICGAVLDCKILMFQCGELKHGPEQDHRAPLDQNWRATVSWPEGWEPDDE